MDKSKSAFSEAKKYIPGGVDSPVRSFSAIGCDPPFIARAKGHYLYDIDGNEYVDFCQSWGPMILGHANEEVLGAVKRVVESGTSFGAPTELETRLAKMVVASVPSIEKVRFVSSGTEAVMSAIRLARGYTGKKKIIKFDGCYHGHADHLLVSAGSGLATLNNPSSAGVPEEFTSLTISIPFNDVDKLKDAFINNKDEIAAVIVEPVPANMGVVLPQEGFLEFLRTITKENNSLLIFDEVITGFRLALGGAQQYLGVTPDITTLGKIIGGGFPVGAYGASAQIMDMLSPDGPVYQAGTLSGNPVAMSAGIATLEQLMGNDFYKNLNRRSSDFINKLEKLTNEYEKIQVNSIGSMFTIFFNDIVPGNFEDVGKSDFDKFSFFYRALLNEGIYFSPSQYETDFLGVSIDPAVVMKKISRALNVIKA